jgi:hypothetical protein
MDTCANSVVATGESPCRAVAYNIDTRTCFHKTGGADRNDATSSEVTIMAYADNTPFEVEATGCPGGTPNGTIETDNNDMQYRIFCETRHEGDNFSWEVGTDYAPVHRDSLSECMNHCSSGGPLCHGVVYSQSSAFGYRNCLPKRRNGTTAGVVYSTDPRSVTTMGLLAINSTCSNRNYTTSNGAIYSIACDSAGDGPDLDSVHAENVEECVDSCSANDKCRFVLYQPNAEAGFKNCYHKFDYQNLTSRSEWHRAVLLEESSEGSESNVWIAGAVVGPVVALLLLAGLLFWWWRRRRAYSADADHTHWEKEPFNVSTAARAHDLVVPAPMGRMEVDAEQPGVHELQVHSPQAALVHELPGSQIAAPAGRK